MGIAAMARRAGGVAAILLVVTMLAGAGLFFVVEQTGWHKAQQHRQEARQVVVAELVFESLYAAMRAGGDTEVLHNTILRLEERLRDQSLYVVRGEALVKQYGDLSHSRHFRREPAVARVLRAEAGPTEWHAGGLRRSATPVRFEVDCVACHQWAVPGEVAAVIVTEQYVETPRSSLVGANLAIYLYVLFAMSLLLLLAYRLGVARRGQ